jgi:class 3 adenylate cyclase
MERRLTAILSADVAGYSGLMEADEVGTLDRLKLNRTQVFDPCVAAHGGRLVELMGDGATPWASGNIQEQPNRGLLAAQTGLVLAPFASLGLARLVALLSQLVAGRFLRRGWRRRGR